MLRILSILILFAAMLFGQAEEVRSINPLYTEQTTVLDDRILGIWPGIFRDSLFFTRSADNFYCLEIKQNDRTTAFEVHLIRAGTMEGGCFFASLYPTDRSDKNYPDLTHILPLYSFYKIDLKADTLIVRMFRYKWFKERVREQKNIPAYVWIPDGLLFTDSAESIIEFITRNDTIAAMYTEPYEFIRDPGEIKTGQQNNSDLLDPDERQKNDFIEDSQDCLPVFPNKHGWLGGDGAISVPLSDGKVLWTFGDTFVGQKDQHLRQGAHMVSNTIAISTCDPDSGWVIDYYWRGMYRRDPSAFFQTHTDRYRYWPQDAFGYNRAIYVALNKVGPGYGLDNGLGFENIGATLARITDYDQKPPEDWQIEYIPWSAVIEQHNWKGMTVHKDHLYLFTQFPDKKAFLRRVPLAHLEQPAEYMEYRSTAGVWKPGTDTADVRPVLEEPISGSGGSVKWHADLGRWILIHGPGWHASEIYLHTAPELTGPWSRGKVIYEVPERTIGQAKFDQTKFCYFAREQAQFYDSDSQTLVFTYDCNMDSFMEVIKRLDVYFPRVVQCAIER